MSKRTLLQRTTALLQKDKRNLRELSELTGLGYFWLQKIKAEQIPDPGVVKVEKLHDFLTAEQ